MDFSAIAQPQAPSPTEPKTNAPEKAKQHGDEEPSVIDRIREAGGFQAFVANLEKEKIAEMRAKILESMGLSEEQLEDMTPEARAEIEDMIAREIQARLAGEKAMEGDGTMSPLEATMVQPATETGPQGTGFGALLALQEAEMRAEGAPLQTRQNLPGHPDDEEKTVRA